MGLSLYEQVKAKPKQQQTEWLDTLSQDTVVELAHKPWWYLARPEQQEPAGDWNVWLILSGRGWGKTRTGGEWLAEQVLRNPKAPDGVPTQWAIIAPTFGDSKNICLEGPSGFLKALDHKGLTAGKDYIYNKSSYKVLFGDGQVVHIFGADTPDAGRGLNLSGAWLDEMAIWNYPYETWTEGLAPALRIGKRPRVVVTTTPKPIKLLREWIKRTDGSVHITRGSTFDNANNLSPSALLELGARYEGTRIGRQELYGEILDDVDGALWTKGVIDRNRIDQHPPLARITVSIDPAVTNTKDSDETGIVVCGSDAAGNGYVIADYSFKGSPYEWATRAVDVFREHKADSILVEVNQGGDMVSAVLRQVDASLPIQEIRAHIGKKLRAEPVAAMYEQGRIHHVGTFDKLEEQMTTWTPDSSNSPDRLDAMVQAFSSLIGTSNAATYFSALANFCTECGLPMPKSSSRCFKCGTAMYKTV